MHLPTFLTFISPSVLGYQGCNGFQIKLLSVSGLFCNDFVIKIETPAHQCLVCRPRFYITVQFRVVPVGAGELTRQGKCSFFFFFTNN